MMESIINIVALLLFLIGLLVYYDYYKRENKITDKQFGALALLVVILFLPPGPLEYVVMYGAALCAGLALWEMR